MLRVMTANLYNRHIDIRHLEAVLDAKRPDVVALQELAPAAARVISQRYPHGLVEPREGTDGSGLVSKSPIEVRRHRLPHRDALVADGDLMIWSVHLANPLDVPPTLRARRDQVSALQQAVEEGGLTRPTLVVGDLNATPAWPAYKALTRRLRDGVADWAQRTGSRLQPTWAYRPGLPPLLRIDHALTAHLVVHDAEVVDLVGSDHRALIVDVEPSAEV